MKANENEILTIAGKRVRVVYDTRKSFSCDGCCLAEDDRCLGRSKETARFPCEKYGLRYAHFISAENTEAAPGAPIAFEHRILGRADISSCCD